MLRWGTCYNFEPNNVTGQPFMYDVGADGKEPEHWCEGLIVLHNPRARVPIPERFFRRYSQHWRELRDRTLHPDFYPWWSITDVVAGSPSEDFKERTRQRRRYILAQMMQAAEQAQIKRTIIT
jgi:hypothetical protein